MIPQPKKILIRIGSLRHGGAEKVLVTLLKNLPADKYEIDLLLNLYSGKYLPEVPAWVNVLYLNKGEMITTNRLQDIPVKLYRKVYQALLKKFPKLLYNGKLKGKKYDVEFAAIHGMRDEILHSPIKTSTKLVWIHNDLTKTHFHNYTEAEFRKFFGFDKIMVISEKIHDDFEKVAKNEAEKQKIIRIYNPIDVEDTLKKSLEPTQKYDFEKGVKTFISVGTVFPQKGFDRLLNAHKRLLEEGLHHKVVIVGDGYDFENIKKLKSELGIDETASMIGFVNNPYPYIKASDFYILSSRYEGFPTILFEAIILKKKIIATDVSGAKEMLDGGNLGFVIENSEESIYENMKKALTDDHLFDEKMKNLENYELPFDLEHSVNSIMKIIDEL